MPAGVVNFCPGAGGTFGDALVSHPKTRYIAFTGSREVGLHINQAGGDAGSPGQIWIKRTILEMGGKDAIIVDADADLDAAVEGVCSCGFRVSGAEVLGVLAADPARERSMTSSWSKLKAARGADQGRRSDGELAHGAGDQRDFDEVDSEATSNMGKSEGTADHRRQARCRSRATATSCSPR